MTPRFRQKGNIPGEVVVGIIALTLHEGFDQLLTKLAGQRVFARGQELVVMHSALSPVLGLVM